MYITLKSTKKAQSLRWSYDHARFDSVLEAYGKPSTEKIYAELAIKEEMRSLNGKDYRITGKSCFTFSCAYRYEYVDSETGEVIQCLVYHTKSNRYVVEF